MFTNDRSKFIATSLPRQKRRILAADDNRDAADSLAIICQRDQQKERFPPIWSRSLPKEKRLQFSPKPFLSCPIIKTAAITSATARFRSAILHVIPKSNLNCLALWTLACFMLDFSPVAECLKPLR